MSAPKKKDLQRAIQWILSSRSFFDLPSSWDFPSDFQLGMDEEELDQALEALAKELDNTYLRMGRIFERLIGVLFACHSDFEVLEKGVGIFEGKQQVTELDYLLKTADGRGLHVEVSVKFYVHRLQPDGSVLITGTNRADVLENRMQKFQRQLSEGKKYARETYPEMEFEHVIFSRGRMFEAEVGDCVHPRIAIDCEKGRWIEGEIEGNWQPMFNRWEWFCGEPTESEELPFKPADEPQNGWVIQEGKATHWLVVPKSDS